MLATVLFLLLQGADLRDGLRALNRGDLAEARGTLESVTAQQPKNARAWAALAQTYSKLGESKLGSLAAARAEQLAAPDPPVFHVLALYYEQNGALAEAAEAEVRYALKTPLNSAAILHAMDLYIRAGQPRSAIEAAHSLPEWKNRADIHNLLGKAYALNKNFDAAAVELQQAMRQDPYLEAYAFDAANLQLHLERFDAAIALLEEGRKTFTRSPQLELALGVAYYGLRRFPEAINQFLKTVSLAPEIEQPYVFLGRMLDQAGDRLPEIISRFVDYERANPKSYLGYLQHAKALRALAGDTSEIAALLRKSLALDDAQWETHFELGLALEAQRDLPESAAELKRAVALKPVEATPHYRLARIYDRLKQPALAAEERRIHQQLTAKTQTP